MTIIKSILILIFAIVGLEAFAKDFIPKKFEASIEQIVVKRIGKKIVRQPLSLKYSFPKNIVMKTKDITYVCNSQTTWRYIPPFIQGQKGECSVGNSNKYCFSKVFDALSSGLKNNKLYVVKRNNKKSFLEIIFNQEASRELGLKSILFFTNKKLSTLNSILEVSKMVLKHNQKQQDDIYEIKSIRINNNLKNQDFIFQIPKNTNVNYLK
ncbi:MAG: hypothetical protein N4A33_07915 [Bacteriovoracaceae bacterium]|jgi:hypothetical protein|nr:hypothetical protein [Bacteriovoracaceae bacterium]